MGGNVSCFMACLSLRREQERCLAGARTGSSVEGENGEEEDLRWEIGS